MLYEHVQPVSRTIFAMVKHCMITEWSKQKWMSLGAYSKVPNRAGFFSLSQKNNYFLQCISLPVPPPSTSSKTLLLRDPEVRRNPLSQSSPCSEWAESVLCISGGGLGSCRPLRIQSHCRAAQCSYGGHQVWGLAHYGAACGSLCLEFLINIWNSWSYWCKTSCE